MAIYLNNNEHNSDLFILIIVMIIFIKVICADISEDSVRILLIVSKINFRGCCFTCSSSEDGASYFSLMFCYKKELIHKNLDLSTLILANLPYIKPKSTYFLRDYFPNLNSPTISSPFSLVLLPLRNPTGIYLF